MPRQTREAPLLYSVIAMGIRAYQGTVRSSITVSPTAITGNFSYDNLSVTVGDSKTSSVPTWTGEQVERTVSYSIARNGEGDSNGISSEMVDNDLLAILAYPMLTISLS